MQRQQKIKTQLENALKEKEDAQKSLATEEENKQLKRELEENEACC